MPAVLLDISNYTPLGAAVEAIQGSVQTGFPPAAPLLVLAGYTLVFAYLARRFFRWEYRQAAKRGPPRPRSSLLGRGVFASVRAALPPYSRQARTAWTSSPARLSARSCRMWLTT